MKEAIPLPAEGAQFDGKYQVDLEAITEQIWGDLEGKTSRADIRRVLAEIAPAYSDARVKTYVPIFLRRDVVRRLQSEITHIRRTTARELEGQNMEGNR